MLEIELKRIAEALEVIASKLMITPSTSASAPVPPAPAAAAPAPAPEAPPVASVPAVPASIFDAPPAPPQAPAPAPAAHVLTHQDIERALQAKFLQLNKDAAPIHRVFKEHFGVTGYTELDPSQYAELIRVVEAL